MDDLPPSDLFLQEHTFTARLATDSPLTLVNSRPLAGTAFVAPFVPCSDEVARAALLFAGVCSVDVLCDLGCGDGRILAAALKNPVESARPRKAIGVELDPNLAHYLSEKVAPQFLGKFAVIAENMFNVDLDKLGVTVVVLYLLPAALESLRPLLDGWLGHDPETRRIVTIVYRIDDWIAHQTAQAGYLKETLYYYKHQQNHAQK
ncbi:hypothetical protein HDU84_003229 [Entophlyctis sp. JEL0112]|nr:hypothetical protein HDU84_003229 [Entophlyctis sp. JEL0112]